MDGYFLCGPFKSWDDELIVFSTGRGRLPVKYIEQCEECSVQGSGQRYSPSSSSYGCVLIEEEGGDARFKRDLLDVPSCSKRKKKEKKKDLDIPSHKRRRIEPCPWELFRSAPSLSTISVEAAEFPFLMVIKPGEGSTILRNLVLPMQVELKHRRIKPCCGYVFSSPRTPRVRPRYVPHCCFYIRCFYSRKSWMLLYQRFPSCCTTFPVLVLLNPITNKRTELPVIHSFNIKDAAFSFSSTTSDANASPDCVIAVVSEDGSHLMSVAMWRPGWETWEMYRSEEPHPLFGHYYHGMVFCGKRVRCFTKGGWMHVFDLNGAHGSWGLLRDVHDPDKDVNRSQIIDQFISPGGTGVLRCVGDRKGSFYFSLGRDSSEILKILSWPDDSGKMVYRFYRLDRLELEWIRLREDEWMGRSWFFNSQYGFSTAAVGGGKMFRKSPPKTEAERVKIICDDLLRNSSHSLAGDFLAGSSWVYLGS